MRYFVLFSMLCTWAVLMPTSASASRADYAFMAGSFAVVRGDDRRAYDLLRDIDEDIIRAQPLLARRALQAMVRYGDMAAATRLGDHLWREEQIQSDLFLLHIARRLSQGDDLDPWPSAVSTDSHLWQIIAAWHALEREDTATAMAFADRAGDSFFALAHRVMIASMAEQPVPQAFIDTLVDEAINVDEQYLPLVVAAMIQHGQTDRARETIRRVREAFAPYSWQYKMAHFLSDSLEQRDSISFLIDNPRQGLAHALAQGASLWRSVGQSPRALLAARVASYLAPNTPHHIYITGQTLADLGSYHLAVDAFSSLERASFQFLPSRFDLIDVLLTTDRDDDAMRIIDGLLNDEPDPYTLWQIANALAVHGEDKQALELYDRAQEMQDDITDNWSFLYYRGATLHRLDMWDRALQDFSAAVKLNQNDAELLNYVGYSLLERLIEIELGGDLVKRAFELAPEDPFIADSVGWYYYLTEQYDKAIEYIEFSVTQLPYDPTVNDHLGDAYWRAGRVREAAYQWQRAINNSDDPAFIETVIEKLDEGLGAHIIFSTESQEI
ncbi:MAG: hypothetical protein AAF442_06200 [Pseudomonadota bacterium]